MHCCKQKPVQSYFGSFEVVDDLFFKEAKTKGFFMIFKLARIKLKVSKPYERMNETNKI